MNKQDLEKTKDPTLPAYLQGMEDYSGLGNSRDAADNTLPFLAILQKGSPQVNKQDPAYIKGAEAGMLFNTATGQLWSQEDGVQFIPCGIQKNLVEWVPRTSGGGYVNTHPFDFDLAKRMGGVRNEKGVIVLPNGNHLVETLYTFGLLPDGSPAVIGASSTALKPMRDWMSQRNAQRLPSGAVAPAFAKTYRLRTVWQKNDSGDWFNWKVFIEDGWTAENMIAPALEFAKMVAEGKAQLGRPDDGLSGGPSNVEDDDIKV